MQNLKVFDVVWFGWIGFVYYSLSCVCTYNVWMLCLMQEWWGKYNADSCFKEHSLTPFALIHWLTWVRLPADSGIKEHSLTNLVATMKFLIVFYSDYMP